MMSNLLLFAFISFGMTTIIVYGSIFKPFHSYLEKHSTTNVVAKFFNDLFGCMLCTSTWVGFFLSVVLFSPVADIYKIYHPISVFFDGMFSAGIVWTINAIVEWFEENRPNDNGTSQIL